MDAITRCGSLTLGLFKCVFIECWTETSEKNIQWNTLVTECLRYLLPAHTGPYINVANHRIHDSPRDNGYPSGVTEFVQRVDALLNHRAALAVPLAVQRVIILRLPFDGCDNIHSDGGKGVQLMLIG